MLHGLGQITSPFCCPSHHLVYFDSDLWGRDSVCLAQRPWFHWEHLGIVALQKIILIAKYLVRLRIIKTYINCSGENNKPGFLISSPFKYLGCGRYLRVRCKNSYVQECSGLVVLSTSQITWHHAGSCSEMHKSVTDALTRRIILRVLPLHQSYTEQTIHCSVCQPYKLLMVSLSQVQQVAHDTSWWLIMWGVIGTEQAFILSQYADEVQCKGAQFRM